MVYCYPHLTKACMHLSREGNRIIMKESLKMKFEWAEN